MFKNIDVYMNDNNSLEKFKTFYTDTLVPNFDIDQIETYEQFMDNIKESSPSSSYHIVLTLDNNNYPIGGVIFDYLKKTNTGFIEYIVVNDKIKHSGVGTFILDEVIQYLNSLAKQNGFERIEFLACEVEKEISGKKPKHYFWKRFGFEILDFYYVQPPLDEFKKPVYIMNFGVVTKVKGALFDKDFVSRDTIKLLLEEYYDEFVDDKYFIDMIKKLENKDEKIKILKR